MRVSNHMAKKYMQLDGVCDLNSMTPFQQDIWFQRIGVGELWGIGRRLAPKLHQHAINTVYDLKHASPSSMRKKFSVVMEKIIRELNGISCIALEEVTPRKKEIIS